MSRTTGLMSLTIVTVMALVFSGCGDDEDGAGNDAAVEQKVDLLVSKSETSQSRAVPAAPGAAEAAGNEQAQDSGAPDKEAILQEIRSEAEQMSDSELRATAERYKEAITTRKAELADLVEQLKELGPAEFTGPKAKSLQAKMGKLNQAINTLMEPLAIYYNKLAERGGDISDLAP